MTAKQRQEWEDQILADKPDINPWILKNLLDLYCSEGGKEKLQELVKEDMKQVRKGKAPVKPSIPSVVEGGSVSAWDEVWEAKAQEINKKMNARVLSEEEAENHRKKNSPVSVEEL